MKCHFHTSPPFAVNSNSTNSNGCFHPALSSTCSSQGWPAFVTQTLALNITSSVEPLSNIQSFTVTNFNCVQHNSDVFFLPVIRFFICLSSASLHKNANYPKASILSVLVTMTCPRPRRGPDTWWVLRKYVDSETMGECFKNKVYGLCLSGCSLPESLYSVKTESHQSDSKFGICLLLPICGVILVGHCTSFCCTFITFKQG